MKSNEIEKQDRTSPSLQSVLSESVSSNGTATPLSFLIAGAGHRASNPRGSANIFEGSDEFVGAYPLDSLDHNSDPDDDEAFKLNDALLDARRVREQTGGKDDFIGLRHVLFAVLVPEEPAIFAPTYAAIAKGGTDPARLSRAIADLCSRSDERGEKKSAWDGIIKDRLPRVLEVQSQLMVADFVAPFRPDDPLSRDLVDRSGAGQEVDAFATMICWHEFRPPLAVGVFGDWGSGKSFFMRQVHNRIATICEAAGAQDDSERVFLGHVVQIRFNAWHYADTNLWASLVEHILTQLDEWAVAHDRKKDCDSLLGKLGAAREWNLQSAKALVARRREVRQAEDAHEKALKELAEKRRELEETPKLWVESAWNTVLADAELKAQVAKAAADVGLTAAPGESVDELREAVERFQARDGAPAMLGWHRLFSRHWIIASLLVVAVIGLPPLFIWIIGVLGLPTDGAGVAGVFAAMTLGATWMTKALNRAHTTLSDVKSRVAQNVAAKTAEQGAKTVNLQTALDVAREKAEAASRDMAAAAERLSTLKARFVAEDRKEQLLNFVRRRAASEDYRNELGFIAQVRRDFDELNRLMYLPDTVPDGATDEDFASELTAFLATLTERDLEEDELDHLRQAVEAPKASERQAFERIVLYIDDLDRCPPGQVILVLQAIHLLLAYPLFVVFVAVDVRWLENALEEAYPQFDRDARRALPEPRDYLEKIFQIPYWVRPMSPEGTAAFMGDILGHRSAAESGEDAPGAEADVGEAGAVVASAEVSGTPADEVPAPVRLTQPIDVTDEERAFLDQLAHALDGSPRRVLRFVNSYRLIKASLGVADRNRLADGGYREVLTLLAIQITLPEVFDAIVSGEGGDEIATHARVAADAPKTESFAALDRALERGGVALADLKQWIGIVARFGFTAH